MALKTKISSQDTKPNKIIKYTKTQAKYTKKRLEGMENGFNLIVIEY